MDLVYTVGLYLLTLQLTAAHVLPPTNVTLHCHNFNNTLEWTYKQLSPGLRFRVDIASALDSYRPPLWVDPPALQANVSFLSDPKDDYFLTVTAVIGQNESESVPFEGIIFSYFQNSQANQICSVDLPPVNVTVESDEKVMIRFIHPWLLYKKQLTTNSNPKSMKMKRHDTQIPEDLPVFEYTVEIINQAQDSHHVRHCMESMCEDKLSVDAAQKKHCLKIMGELEKMRVQGTQEYCAQPFESHFDKYLEILLYIGVSLFALVAFAVILFMVYRKKTVSSTPLPSSMTITKQVKQWTMKNVREQTIVPVAEPTSPSPLLPEKEVIDSTPVETPLTEYDFRMPIGVSIENDCGVCDVTEVEQQKDEYMQGTNLDEEEFIHSSYEKRQVVDVELAPGEQAEGYRG